MLATGLRFPNGLTKGPHERLYVPSSFLGVVSVFEPQGDKLVQVDEIDAGIPLDNLSVDPEGSIWAAGITDVISFFKAHDNPYVSNTSATVLRFREKVDGGFEVEKVLEDGLSEVLPGTTTVVHDVKTARLFLSSTYLASSRRCLLN
jgi:arylesterase / paraoxonase